MTESCTRTRILSASGPIFADKGFQSATIRDICESAGVNIAAVNYYFGDKQKLYLETVKHARQSRAEQVPMPQWPVDTPTEVKLREYIRTLLQRMLGLQQAPWQVRLMMREVVHPTAACTELVQDYFGPVFNVLLGILDEVLPLETPRHIRQQIGFSIIGQCVHYRLAGQVVALMVGRDELQENYDSAQLAEHVTQFSLAALGLGPSITDLNRQAESATRSKE